MFETALEEDEIVTSVSFPLPEAAAYMKFENPASRYAIVGVFVAKTGGEVRVGVTGATACAHRGLLLEEAMGGELDASGIDSVELPVEQMNSDIHASAEYRAHLVKVMTKRAVGMPVRLPMSREPGSIEQTQALLEQANYVADRALSTTLFLALKMQRPLFLEGEAGVEKPKLPRCSPRPLIVVWFVCSATKVWTLALPFMSGITQDRCWKSGWPKPRAPLTKLGWPETSSRKSFLSSVLFCRPFARTIEERQFCSLMSWTEQTNRLRLFCWSCYPKTRFRFLRSARCGQRNPRW